MKKVWKKITVITDTQGSELAADAFFSIGCGGVEIIDKNDILQMIKDKKPWDYIDENLFEDCSSIVKVSAFVARENLKNKLEELNSILKNYGISGEIILSDVTDQNWYETWKEYYKPLIIGNFVVVPEWLKFENKQNLTQISLDPGMAFGTGEHQSTKLCLELMSILDFTKKTVIDVGCGSGILGIAAIKKNARRCYMYDIDTIATHAAKTNAKLNNIKNPQIFLGDLLMNNNIKADIILANLTADILIRLSKDIKKHLNKGGVIIQSGIIEDKFEQTKQAYKEQGFIIKNQLGLDQWRAFMVEAK